MLHVLVSISLQCIWSSSECGLCGQLDGYNYDGFAPSLKLFSYIYIYIYGSVNLLASLHHMWCTYIHEVHNFTLHKS